MTAIAAPARLSYSPGRIRALIYDTWDITWRNCLTMLRTPQTLAFALVQPILFVLLFRYAFGGAIRVTGVPYVDYLMPGIFAQSVTFGAMGTAVGLSTDVRTGLLERFRTLPISRLSIVAGRTLADLLRSLVVLAVMVGMGFAVGFRPRDGVAAFIAALGLVLLFSYCLSWVFVSLGLRASNAEAATAAGMPIVVLLVFASPAFIPVDTMPGWLQSVASRQPLAALVNALHSLVLGGPAAGHVIASVAWSVGLFVFFAALAARQYQRLNR
jgi:ABC-2 type transport system permease protein